MAVMVVSMTLVEETIYPQGNLRRLKRPLQDFSLRLVLRQHIVQCLRNTFRVTGNLFDLARRAICTKLRVKALPPPMILLQICQHLLRSCL